MSELHVAVIAGVINGVVASGLVVAYSLGQSWLTGKRQGTGVRQMLWQEVERNVKLCAALRLRLEQENRTTSGLTFINGPLPPWSQAVWVANLDNVRNAVSQAQSQQLFDHYGCLDSLREEYKALSRLRAEQLGYQKNYYAPFSDAEPYRMAVVGNLLDEVIALGNPVPRR